MSEEIVDRLRQALTSRAEQVTPESLRPAEVPHSTRAARGSGAPGGSWWTTWRTPILAAAAAAAVIAGLATLGPRPDDDETLPAGPPTMVTGSPCEGEAELVTAFVAVRTAAGATYSTALAAPAVPPPGVGADVIALPDLGADGSADIVVDTHVLADGALAQLFTLTDDGLERVPGPAFEDGNFVVEGGGVTSPQAAGCTADGSFIVSMATTDPQGQTFTVTRQTYPVTGNPLEFGSPDVSTGQVSAAELTTRFPEFGPDSYAPCGRKG